ncbi:hypothetical protein [Rugosimonospora africana]|uniref:Uncharacterized protein n=1 Tax=Rugosimonospora africana TaxID=556532 RepID=A0A8J3QRB9_9ACTN|nr:hypothetical protein [Rugosimonospora africana]GIH15121.1 hypothetical protein Raf01_32930 [Rugosimonospora africana]
MEAPGTLSGPRAATFVGLVAGLAALAVLWASGRFQFPMYPPPGIITMLAGVLLVGLVPRRWAPGVGAVMGLVILAAFLYSGGPLNLAGRQGAMVALGNWIQIPAGFTAVIGGVMAVRTEGRLVARRSGRQRSGETSAR